MHWMQAYGPAIFISGGLVVVGASLAVGAGDLSVLVVFIVIAAFFAALLLFGGWVRMSSTIFAITDRRVLTKRGILLRETFELRLDRIEGIGTKQNIVGEWLDFGTLVFTGTGG